MARSRASWPRSTATSGSWLRSVIATGSPARPSELEHEARQGRERAAHRQDPGRPRGSPGRCPAPPRHHRALRGAAEHGAARWAPRCGRRAVASHDRRRSKVARKVSVSACPSSLGRVPVVPDRRQLQRPGEQERADQPLAQVEDVDQQHHVLLSWCRTRVCGRRERSGSSPAMNWQAARPAPRRRPRRADAIA